MKKFIFSAALLMAAATVSFAGNPKETKEAKAETKMTTAVVKWFHFTGDASLQTELEDPANYVVEASPTCSTTPALYRCDIQILTQEDDQTQPDLSQPVLAERKRTTAN